MWQDSDRQAGSALMYPGRNPLYNPGVLHMYVLVASRNFEGHDSSMNSFSARHQNADVSTEIHEYLPARLRKAHGGNAISAGECNPPREVCLVRRLNCSPGIFSVIFVFSNVHPQD